MLCSFLIFYIKIKKESFLLQYYVFFRKERGRWLELLATPHTRCAWVLCGIYIDSLILVDAILRGTEF